MKQVSVKIDDDMFDWLAAQIREGRFASVSHGIRFALKELIRREKESG